MAGIIIYNNNNNNNNNNTVMIVLYSLSNLLTHISIHYLVVALNSPKLFDNFHNISGETPSYIPE